MASANSSQPDLELGNNPENKGGSSEVAEGDTHSHCDSGLDISIADQSSTDQSQAISEQDGSSSSAAITKSPSRDLTETHTSPDARPNHDVYQSVPENGPDVLAGEGQQPGSAGRRENDMVLDSAADVVPQVSSDSHQNTGTSTQEGSDHQEGSRYQALAVAISPKVSAFGQHREDSASSFPFQDTEEESLNTYAQQQEWCFNFSLVILPDLTCTTTGLNLPVQVVPRDNRPRSFRQHHDQQPGEYDQARLVNLVRYRDFDADLCHGEGGPPVQESGNQLQNNYNVARAVQLVNYRQTSRLLGSHDFQQEDDADDGDTDE